MIPDQQITLILSCPLSICISTIPVTCYNQYPTARHLSFLHAQLQTCRCCNPCTVIKTKEEKKRSASIDHVPSSGYRTQSFKQKKRHRKMRANLHNRPISSVDSAVTTWWSDSMGNRKITLSNKKKSQLHCPELPCRCGPGVLVMSDFGWSAGPPCFRSG